MGLGADHEGSRARSVLTPALLAVAGAAVCSGAATVLQSVAAGRLPRARRPDASLLVGLARSRLYLAALGLVAAGFLLALFAVRVLPLFLVQAGRASSLAVTALLSVLVLRAPLGRRDVLALVAVGAGLLVLAAAADPSPSAPVDDAVRWWMLAGVLALAALGAALAHVTPEHHGGVLLAVLAGTGFAVLALGARTVRGFSPADLLGDPAAWAMAGAGLLGLLLSAMAFQRSTVVTVTAVLVATETVLASGLGMLVNGDRPRDGMAAWAVLGFVLTVGGALALSRSAAASPAPLAPATVAVLDEKSAPVEGLPHG